MDPPYGVDYSSKNVALNAADKGNRIQRDIENDALNDNEFIEFLTKVFTNADIHMKPGAAFYIWYAECRIKTFILALEKTALTAKETLVWVKNNMVLGRQDYQHRHEPCLYGWKEGAGHYFIDLRSLQTVMDNTETLSKEKLLDELKKLCDVTTTIYENKPQASELHPTMKPVPLFKKLIRNSSKEGDIVLDLFGGSGTTLVACEEMDRTCYMMEYDPKYAEVILQRWEEQTGEKAVKEN